MSLDPLDLLVSYHTGWADGASCFILEVGYASTGPELFIGPFATPQDAMVYEIKMNDEHTETSPDDEPYVSTLHCVRPPTLKEDMT